MPVIKISKVLSLIIVVTLGLFFLIKLLPAYRCNFNLSRTSKTCNHNVSLLTTNTGQSIRLNSSTAVDSFLTEIGFWDKPVRDFKTSSSGHIVNNLTVIITDVKQPFRQISGPDRKIFRSIGQKFDPDTFKLFIHLDPSTYKNNKPETAENIIISSIISSIFMISGTNSSKSVSSLAKEIKPFIEKYHSPISQDISITSLN